MSEDVMMLRIRDLERQLELLSEEHEALVADYEALERHCEELEERESR